MVPVVPLFGTRH